jgi:hypothetical protein
MEGTWQTAITGKVGAIRTIAVTRISIANIEKTAGSVAASVPNPVALANTTEAEKTIGTNACTAAEVAGRMKTSVAKIGNAIALAAAIKTAMNAAPSLAAAAVAKCPVAGSMNVTGAKAAPDRAAGETHHMAGEQAAAHIASAIGPSRVLVRAQLKG